jgi:hypothetical protein
MFDTVVELLDQLDAVLDQLLATDLTTLDADALLDATHRWNTTTRRSSAIQHRVEAELDQRHLAVEHGYRDTAGFLRELWNITPSAAKRETLLARDLAPGRTLTGQPVPPIFATLSAAEATGDLSVEHAKVIITAIDKLPHPIAAAYDTRLETDLVNQARDLDPAQLALTARRASAHLDPDGVLREETYRDRTRDLTLAHRPDGSAHLQGELTAPCAEALLTVLDSLAKPAPEADGSSDTRTPGQRRHDGLLDGLNRLLRDGGLPDTGGVKATILLTVSEEHLRAQAGLVSTGHGALISLALALKIATDARLVPIVLTAATAVAAHGSGHRIAKPGQRLALAARDRGCSFPGCDIPPAWTEAHHVIEYHDGGPTTLDNLASRQPDP